MFFAENQEKNESYTFKEMLLQSYKSYFILAMVNSGTTNSRGTRKPDNPLKVTNNPITWNT